MPRVSVLMPAYNAGPYLDDAIKSVLDQSFADFELLLIDDGSTDDTADRIDRWAAQDSRIRPLSNAGNIGLTRTLNVGLTEARGDFVARLDADDLSKPDRFALQLAAFEANDALILVGAREETIDAAGRRRRLGRGGVGPTAFRWMARFAPPVVHSSAMIRMAPVRALGLSYDETMITAQDMAFWQTLLRHGDGCRLGETLVSLRVHSDSISVRASGRQSEDARRALVSGLGQDHPDMEQSDLEMIGHAVFGQASETVEPDRVLTRLLEIETRFLQGYAPDTEAQDQIRRHLIDTVVIAATRYLRAGDTGTAARLIWALRRCGPKVAAESLAILGRRSVLLTGR